MKSLVDKLANERSLSLEEYELLVRGFDASAAEYAQHAARVARERIWGKSVFARGLIEISSYCKNDCLYCGMRRSNSKSRRYRLFPEEICACADKGYEIGFRTFVLQGGEDPYFTDNVLCSMVQQIKEAHPDCAVTLSMGERSHQSYKSLFSAGAERYLLRHETANPSHYSRLHPSSMSWEERIRCLEDLRDIGYAVGCGFMVGSPYQTPGDLACDLKFIERFMPEMCGIGPFIPHHATPFSDEPGGSVSLTCYLLSLLRLMRPGMLLPATTALGSAEEDGREKGILAGANVVMPNLSPLRVRPCYDPYDNKASAGIEGAEGWKDLDVRMRGIGYELVVDRGDPKCT